MTKSSIIMERELCDLKKLLRTIDIKIDKILTVSKLQLHLGDNINMNTTSPNTHSNLEDTINHNTITEGGLNSVGERSEPSILLFNTYKHKFKQNRYSVATKGSHKTSLSSRDHIYIKDNISHIYNKTIKNNNG